MTPTVAIVSACRNEIRHIDAFLESVFSQDMGGLDWEILIADGASDDGTREALERWAASHPRLRVIPNPARIVSTGLNEAIRAARAEIIIRMDAHTTYAPDYCRRCVETLARTGAENVGGPARTRVSGTYARAIAAAYHSRFSTGGAKFHDENFEGWVDTVPYGCWRKDTLLRLGAFDESLARNQDDELNFRITRFGGRIFQNPEIVSWYSPRSSVSALFRQYFQYGFWKVAVIKKHRMLASWRHLIPALLLLAMIMLFLAIVASMAGLAPAIFNVTTRAALALAVAYLAANLLASILTARRNGWELFRHLPAVFAAFHFSYGLGFLAGLAWFLPRTALPGSDSVFARVTR